jgi:hypothetical protein
MLKAYSFIENEHMDSGIVDRNISNKEHWLISEFVTMNPASKVELPCVFCAFETKEFDIIDNTYYQRCKSCYSIFASVEDEIVEHYIAYKPLVDFRNSIEYQASAAERRAGIWSELLFWLEFRIARYMNNSTAVDIIDVGNRYLALSRKIKQAKFCKSYNKVKTADVVLFIDQFRCLTNPTEKLLELRDMLSNNGLLVMNMRVGSGFDVLTLKGCKGSVFPYEVICLPSIEGLEIILHRAGFDILEVSTPGSLDIEHVMQNKMNIDEDDLFVQYLINKADNHTLTEFQRFLQKSGMSSHARVIARKRP